MYRSQEKAPESRKTENRKTLCHAHATHLNNDAPASSRLAAGTHLPPLPPPSPHAPLLGTHAHRIEIRYAKFDKTSRPSFSPTIPCQESTISYVRLSAAFAREVSAPVTRGFTPCRNRTYVPRGVAGGEKGSLGSPRRPLPAESLALPAPIAALRCSHIVPQPSAPNQIAILPPFMQSFISHPTAHTMHPCESSEKLHYITLSYIKSSVRCS